VRALALVALALLIVPAIAAPAMAQEGEVGVPNVPPTFGAFSVYQTDGHFAVKVSAVDYNGWADMTNVTVDVLVNGGELTGAFVFRQFSGTNGNATRIDEFSDVQGDWLVRSQCTVKRTDEGQGNAIAVRCTMDITFIFVPGDGDRIRITIYDRYGLNATGLVPYKYGEVKLPDILRTPQATLSISGAIAIGITAIIVRGRMASDSLARSIETRRKRKADESLDDIMARLEEEK
jgi:hypothetical protein